MSRVPRLRPLIAPWQWARNEQSRPVRWLRAVFWLVMLVAPVALALRWAPTPAANILVALWLALALLGLWSWHFAALLRLDHPHLARLVPAHAAGLRATALALWVGATVVGGAGATALLSAASWPVRGAAGLELLPVALVAAGAMLDFVALTLRWPLLWLLLALLPFTGSLPQSLLRQVQPFWQARPWLACVSLLVAMALVLVALFGRGDAAHARTWAQRERWRRITRAGMVGQKPTLAAYGRWGEWLGAPWQRLADAWLVRATRQAQPTAASAMTRAEIVLHGAQHWVRQLGVLVPLLLGLTAMFTVVAWSLGPTRSTQVFVNGHLGMGIGLLSMVLGAVVSLPGSLWMSRREQALLMLLPGMPRGAALNRALAWRQARHFLLLWGLSLPAYLGLAWAAQVPQLLAMPVAALMAMPWLWRNAARQREPSVASTLVPIAVCLVPGIATVALLRETPALFGPLVGGMAAVAAMLLAGRWRQVSRWPQALPAGRWG